MNNAGRRGGERLGTVERIELVEVGACLGVLGTLPAALLHLLEVLVDVLQIGRASCRERVYVLV